MASVRELLARAPTVAGAIGALEELVALAFTDPTTKLPNRRALDEVTKLPLDFDGYTFGVLMIDLTGFKRVNDECGHAAGDAALGEVGATLLKVCRLGGPFEGAMPFRYGGDEFCILVPQAAHERIVEDANLARLQWTGFTWEKKPHGFGASIGIADPDSEVGLPESIAHADAASKASKGRGDKPVRWSSSLAAEALVSRRKRCPSCGATTTVVVSESRVARDGFRNCANCGATLP